MEQLKLYYVKCDWKPDKIYRGQMILVISGYPDIVEEVCECGYHYKICQIARCPLFRWLEFGHILGIWKEPGFYFVAAFGCWYNLLWPSCASYDLAFDKQWSVKILFI